jgi:opacity protein-like surface antigen
MKQKFLLSLLFVCALLATSYAQIKKGSTWLGTNISYSQSKDRPNNQMIDREISSTNVMPAFGTAIKDNLVVGVFGSYTDTHKEHEEYIIDQREKSYGGGLFARRYVPVFNRFYIFGEGRARYLDFKTDQTWSFSPGINGTGTIKGWEAGISFTPGISYGITNNIQLEAGFASLFDATYRSSKATSNYLTSEQTTKSFSTGINLENVSRLFIGVRFLINKG